MKKLIFLLLMIPVVAFAVESSLVGGNKPIQAFAPLGNTTVQSVSKVGYTLNLTEVAQYGIFNNATSCRLRFLPTSTKTTYGTTPIPTGLTILAKNPATPFVNFTGCRATWVTTQ